MNDKAPSDGDAAQTPASTAEPAPTRVPPLAILQFARDYFVVLSAATVVLGIALATTFLYAYLSVFDWHLMWLVQYPDIITFGLIAVGVVAGWMSLLYAMIENVLSTGIAKGTPNRTAIKVVVGVLLLLAAWQLYSESRGFQPRYWHLFYGWITLFCVAVFVVNISMYINHRVLPNARQTLAIVFSIFFGVFCFGLWLGYGILESPYYVQDVFLRNQTITNARMILAMSRHTILLTEGKLVIVPTGDVQEVRTDVQPYPR